MNLVSFVGSIRLDDRDEELSEKLHEVNVHIPNSQRRVVESFLSIIQSDHPVAQELTELIAAFEKRLEAHDLENAREKFCETE